MLFFWQCYCEWCQEVAKEQRYPSPKGRFRRLPRPGHGQQSGGGSSAKPQKAAVQRPLQSRDSRICFAVRLQEWTAYFAATPQPSHIEQGELELKYILVRCQRPNSMRLQFLWVMF